MLPCVLTSSHFFCWNNNSDVSGDSQSLDRLSLKMERDQTNTFAKGLPGSAFFPQDHVRSQPPTTSLTPKKVQASNVSFCGPFLLSRLKHNVGSVLLPFGLGQKLRRDVISPRSHRPQTPRASYWQPCLGWQVCAELPGPRMTAGVATKIFAPIMGGFAMLRVGVSCPSDLWFFFLLCPRPAFQKGWCIPFSQVDP